MEDIQKLLREMQVDFICASKNTKRNAPSGRLTLILVPKAYGPPGLRQESRALGATILK